MIVSTDQAVRIHNRRGVTLYEFIPENVYTLSWSRALRRTTKCDFASPPLDDSERLPDVVPWLHWATVYDDAEATLWTGPIEKARAGRSGLALTAKDHSAFLRRTEIPRTLDWEATDPAFIAAELWRAMMAHHGIAGDPLVAADPEGDRFDFSVVGAVDTLDSTIEELVRLGLRWAVSGGTVVLGPLSAKPRAELSGADFIDADIGLLRDGSETFNSVRVRGADGTSVRETVPLHDLNLQTVANIDSVFGLSNASRAARQYARQTAEIRTALDIPNGAELHPDAPVSIHELVPSARFVLTEYGVRELVELESLDVELGPGSVSVKVGLESVTTLPELAKKLNDNGQGGGAG